MNATSASPAGTAAATTAAAPPRPSSFEKLFGEYFDCPHFPARVPLLRDGIEHQRHAVTIVGGGPTGLTLALGLAGFGVPSVLIESDPSICTGSRAGAFTRRTLEILERVGVAQKAIGSGLAWYTGWTFHGQKEIARLQIPHDENQKFPPAISQLQNRIEWLMVQAAERSGLIDIRWQSRVETITQSEDKAELSISTPAGNYRLHSDWVVACDGGQSTLRRLLDLRMEGERHAGRYVIIDIRVDTSRLDAGRHCWFGPPSNPEGTMLMYKKPDGMLRFDYQLGPDEDEAEAMREEAVFATVQRQLDLLGIDSPWQPVWMTLYRASAMTLPSYLHGRVLFAGDAAHLVPIFGVRGMNSALEDAHNLAWKLAFVQRGLATRRLLQSYSSERVGAARFNMLHGSRGARFMSPPSAAEKILRDAVLQLSERIPAMAQLVNPRQHAAAVLSDSPLNARIESASDGVRSDFVAGPIPGAVLTECPLRLHDAADAMRPDAMRPDAIRQGYVTDLLGPWISVLVLSADGSLPLPLLQAAQDVARTLPLRVALITCGEQANAPSTRRPMGSAQFADVLQLASDPQGKLRALYGATASSSSAGTQSLTVYVVRPDGHVCARWHQSSGADGSVLQQALRRLRGDAAA